MDKSRHHLAEVIAERTLQTQNTAHLAKEVAAYLLDKHLTTSLDSLIRDVLQYRADHGVVEATAVSAYELDATLVSDIKTLLHDDYPDATTIMVNQEIDRSVIGGVRVDLANEVLDITTQSQLNKFKRLTGAQKGTI